MNYKLLNRFNPLDFNGFLWSDQSFYRANCIGWYQWTNTPDLLWGPFIPNNPFGYSYACDGSNYANIQGGYFGSGVGYFDTETLAGNFTVPLTAGRTFCLSACVSMAD